MKFIWHSCGIYLAISHITSVILMPYVTHITSNQIKSNQIY